jgi:hypothetical protein
MNQLVSALLLLLILAASWRVAGAQEAFTLPSAKVGVAYEYSFHSEGGLPPLQWKVVAGNLPQGIQLSTTGVLKGIPTSVHQESFEFTAAVEDSERPPQRSVQRFMLAVAPSELHIVLPMQITPPAQSKGVDSEPSATLESRGAEVKQIAFAPARAPHWVIPLQESVPSPVPQASSSNDAQKSGGLKSPKNPLDPATFIRVFEETKSGGHLCRYEPARKSAKNPSPADIDCESSTPHSLQFGVDLESSILIVPVAEKMGDDPALNKLYVTAKLASGDSSKDLVVTGYSEIGQDKSAMTAQSGTAFQSAANVEAMVFNMAYTVGDIVRYVYLPNAPAPSATPGDSQSRQVHFQDWLKTHGEIDLKSKSVLDTDSAISGAIPSDKPFSVHQLQQVQDRLRLYQPEIQAISDFFLQKENLAIVERVGVEVFSIDRNSLQAIAQQYKDNIQIAFDSKSTPVAQAQALQDLLERTKLVYEDFGDFRNEIRGQMRSKYKTETHTDEEWNAIFQSEILNFSHKQRKDAFKQLKSRLATGSISLPDYQAKDGDRLKVTVESLPADSTTGGVPVVFEIAIKKYGAKTQWSPSLLFIRRLGVTDAEATPPAGSTVAPLNRINFAPSPGMTFGVAYFKRGRSGSDKFWRALGPGAGMNVTFMNFNDPSFDLATSQFVNTNGTNVQVGAGVIGSLFDNKIQFTYGWNLNVERRRNYWGVGFGFIEIGKELTKYMGK